MLKLLNRVLGSFLEVLIWMLLGHYPTCIAINYLRIVTDIRKYREHFELKCKLPLSRNLMQFLWVMYLACKYSYILQITKIYTLLSNFLLMNFWGYSLSDLSYWESARVNQKWNYGSFGKIIF